MGTIYCSDNNIKRDVTEYYSNHVVMAIVIWAAAYNKHVITCARYEQSD